MNINQKIQEFLTEHQYQKKRRIFTAVLSLMIVFSVVSSLIMPAISMTMQDLDDAAAVDTIDAEPGDENIMLLGLGDENRQTEPINLAERATSISISAFDLGEKGDKKENIENGYIINTNKTNVAFEVSYTLSNMENVFKKDADFEHLYIDIENFTISNTYNGELNDAAYSEYMQHQGMGLVNPGTYEVVGNKIKIHLTDAYIKYIDSGEGNVTGTLNFSGELSRNNTASGDQTVNIGGKDFVIPFQDKNVSLTKNGWVDSANNGDIVWTITVNPNGLSLKDYTLVDNMLQNASGDVSINPAGAAIYDFNSKKVTFNESNTDNVTITYRTKIGTEDLKNKSVTNKATLQKNGENPIEASNTVSLDRNPIHVNKDGKADYENGKPRNNKIDWTITIASKYGTSLNGYQIKDANLPDNDVTISPSGTLTKNGDGTWTLNVADNVTGVTLNYSADATDGDNKNSVSIHYPDGSPTDGKAEKTVNYKKESEMISVNKNGNYNQDTHEITWTIRVTPENGYSLNGYYLEDRQFPSSTDQFTASGCNTSDFKIESGKLTFTSDIKQAVTLQYKTKVSVPENNSNAEVTTVVTNEIKDKFTKTTVVSVSVKSRNTIAKTAGSQNMSLSQSNAISQKLSWKVDITRDNGFDGYIYKDTLSASANGTQHTITTDEHTDEQLAALKILAKTQEYGNATELKQGTDYNIVKDTNGFHIEFLSTTKDYNYISFEYNTTATIPESAAYGQYTFNNKGSSNKGGGEPNPGVTIEKKNPVQTIDMKVRKDWKQDTADKRPSSITFKVQYQETNTGDWKDLRKSGNTYLFDGDNDYSSASVVEVTVDSNGNWATTVSNLPVSVTKNDTTKTYQYRVQEIKYNDAVMKNGEISINSGIYRANNNGISNAVSQNNGEASVTNTYYPNISLTPVKDWKDSNNQTITNYDGDITEITVQLVSRGDDWKFYPVKDSSGKVLTATLNASNGWGKNLTAWSGLSSEKNYLLIETAVKLKDGTTKNLFSVSDNGTDYNNKEMSFAVDGTYYKATLLGNSVQPTADTTISVTNTVYETKNITVQAKKEWKPSKPDGVSGVVVELQRKASNLNDWTAYPENDTTKSQQTLNNSNSWHASWSNLPNQNVDSTGRISYTYRVVEVGYVKADEKTIVPLQNDKFALANANGLYKATYQNQELTKDGTVAITNTYESLKSIELTPEKKWEGDNETVRPTSITLQLQRKAGENGEWQNVEGKTVTLTSSDLPNQWDKSIWKSDSKKFTDLPTNEIKVNANGSYTETVYSYRLIETGYTLNGTTTTIPAGDVSFKVSVNVNGENVEGNYTYSSSISSENGGTLTITNDFKENVGILKYSWGNGTTPVDSIDASNIESLNSYLKDINGEQYYVFNWEIEYSTTDPNKVPLVADKLPDGFTLCVDIDSKYFDAMWSVPTYGQLKLPNGQPVKETSISWTKATVSTPLDENQSRGGNGYYTNPCIIWKNAGGVNYIAPVNSKENAWRNPGEGDSRYYYDAENNIIYFGLPRITEAPAFLYSIKIKKADLEAKIAQGNVKIENHADVYDLNGNPTGKDDNASLIIKNQTPTDLITKTYQAAALPGYISYTLDINPQGKTLSSGDTIDIEDLFKTVSYCDSDRNNEITNGTNLVDVLMRNINIYKIDANGDKQQLSANDYTLQFDCSENGVQSDGEKGAALLKLTVPDATHLQVTYSYKIIANKNTPSVIHGCKVRKNGRYVPMESGLVPPAGDKITFSNTAKLKADSASGESSHNNQEYTVFQSGGTISTNPIPKIYKVNTGDYTIKSLNASFLLAKYESGSWYYASNVNADGAITWGKQSFSGKMVPKADATDAYVIEVKGRTQPKISLEQNVLYKLVEISVPAGYEGSNLNLPSGTDFRALITGYLNSNLTTYNNKDYTIFLDNYNPNHYFSFNSNVSGNNIPHDVSQSEIQQIKSGDDLNISNSELIDIGVQKQWVNSNNTAPEDASITVELYWSYEKSTSGIPASATLATATDLGILDSSFTATKTLTKPENAKVWTDLPNGKAGKPIYYYVKETAYTYGGNTYTLQEDGSYKDGSYLPIYQNNAANGDATVQIQNTQRLMLKKVWKDINNQDMNPLSSSVDVTVYGVKVDSAGNETKEALFTDPVTLGNTNSWQLDITDKVSGKDLSAYKRFEVTETDVDTSNMVISCVFNLNQNTGDIIVTNKSTQPTDASVTVQKAWSDGETLHASESVQVSLYQSTKALPANTELTAAWITANATKMTDAKYTVSLNKDNEWTYTWTGLSLKNESEQPYYYYVLEDLQNSNVANKDKYTATYTKSSNSTAYKTNYTITNSRSAITVQKQWYDEDGNLITNLYDEDGNLVVNNMANLKEITLKVYKKTGTTAPSNLKVLAIGDSITNGDGNNNKGYWDYLKQDLNANNITVAGEANTWKKGRTGYAIKEVNSGNASGLGLTYTENRSGIYESIDGDFNDAPDVVLLMAGTNDIISNYRTGIITRLQSLIEKVHEKAPNAVIFVASIPDFNLASTSGSVVNQNWFKYYDQTTGNVVQYQQISYNEAFEKMINGFVKDYNTQIQSLVNTLSSSNGYKIKFVDINSVVPKSYLEDGCHPNDDGNKLMATAYSNAIQDYYTSKEPVQENGQDLTITLNNSNNWRTAIDVPAGNGTYCVEEVNVPDGWDVTYENNAQQANSTTPILVKNQKQPTDIDLTVEKTWAKDDASNRPDSISLTLLRSNGKKQDNSDAANTSEWFWEELRISTPTPTKNGNKWTFAYTGLPAKDVYGNDYYYKVQEAAVNGYTISYGLNGAGEENGVTAAAGETATLHVTNTRAIALQIEKQWSDGATNQHLQDAVQVRIYRSTNPSDVPTANLTLQVTPETVSVGVNGTATVTANKDITIKENSNGNVAEVSVTGKTLTITGKETGETTITVTDGTMEKQISVIVSAEPTLNLSIDPPSIQVGETATLTPSMSDGSDCSGVTYEIKTENDVVSIDGNTVTGLKAGTATIVAKMGNKTSNEVTITVTEPPLSLNPESVTVSVGDTATIQANRTVTISENPVDSIATVTISEDGKNITVAGVAAGSTSFKVKDSDKNEKTVSVTVNPKQVANGKVLTSGETYTFEIPADKQENIKKLEVSLKDYPTNKSNDGVDVYFNASNKIDTHPNSWIKFNDDGSMKDLYIFNDGGNYFSKKTRDGYTFGTVSGNTAIWEKTTASKNEKIIFRAKAACTITQIKITYKNGESYTVIDFGGGDSGGGDTPSTPTQITLTANSTTLKVGGTLQLNSNVTGVTYSSSNAQVATVNANGLVTGVGAGSVTITATKDGCTDGTIDLTVTSDSSSGGGESGGGSGGSESGETKTVTIESGKETDFWFNDAHSDVAISSIMIDAKGISGDKQMRVRFRSNNADWAGDFYIKNYNNTLSKDAESNCNVSLSGTVFTIDSFKYNLNRITFTESALSGDVAITINYATTPQSLSAPRRAVAAAAVIESEQLLSDSNETAGVQTQALENTIDASEVSDSDWANGLLLEIDAADNWQGSVTNLPVTDSNGNTYYYWAVEEPVTGYTPSYLFQDADGSQSNAIKADAQADGTDIIILNTKQDTSYTLPSTGGTGVTRYYLIGLLLMGGSGLVICYQFRRKRHGNCAK